MQPGNFTKPPPVHYAWIILAVGTLAIFGALGLARFGYTMVLPAMQKELGFNNTLAGGLATANLIGYLALSVSGGALAARFGPRIIITMGLAVAAAGMLMTGLSNSFVSASIWRAITGIGSGASNVPALGLLAAWFVQHRRGLASGIGVTGSSFALIALGIIVPYILELYGINGWRVCWFFFAAITFGLSLLAFMILRNKPSELGLLPIGAAKDIDKTTVKEKELNWGRVYRSGVVWHLGIIYIAFGFSYIIYMTFFTKYLIADGGYTQESAGRLFMLMGCLSLFCGIIWGSFSDKFGRKTALVIVYIIQAASFGLFALWPSAPGFILSAVLFGLSAWSIPAIMAAACGDLLGPRLAPAGLGFITLFFGIGQAAGPSVAGIIADASHSLSPAMLLAMGVAILGAVGSMFLKRSSPEHTDVLE
jgi:MFS family permease